MLTDVFRAACVGRAGAVLVGGDAGVGKTRLVEELARQARQAGSIVLAGNAIDIADAPPFWPRLRDPQRVRGQTPPTSPSCCEVADRLP